MTLTLLGPLAVLALIDSTSVGTMLIPVWLLLAPAGLRASRVVVFLGTVATFYLLVGLALLAGADTALVSMGEVLSSPAGSRVQLVAGLVLLGSSFVVGTRSAGGGRVLRWRDRAMGESSGRGSVWSLMGLALAAAAIEVATMLPYLAAIGLLATSDLHPAGQVTVLAGYCAVMVLPALALLGARLAARRLVQPVLTRVARWMERNGAETTAWVVGIVGFLVARDALGRLPALNAVLGGLGG